MSVASAAFSARMPIGITSYIATYARRLQAAKLVGGIL